MRAVRSGGAHPFEPKSGWPGLETPAAADVVGSGRRSPARKIKQGRLRHRGRTVCGAGIPTVVIGPGSIDQAHKADELSRSRDRTCGAFLDRLTAHSSA